MLAIIATTNKSIFIDFALHQKHKGTWENDFIKEITKTIILFRILNQDKSSIFEIILYIIIINKYLYPMLFKDVIGHRDLKLRFINDTLEDRVSHAHLLLGNLGHGGLPLALAFSQYLLCENKKEEDSCGICGSCKKVQKLEHPDLHFTFPTVQADSKISDPLFPQWKSLVLENPFLNLNKWITHSDEKGRKPIISVHQSVEIIKKLNFKSFGGGYKISILWMAEEMNVACANKLLKIIEEPPYKTVFILLAESEDMILPTILSRTQITKIKQLSDEDLTRYLEEKESGNEEIIQSVVSRSEGNLSLALELLKSEEKENSNFDNFVELMRVGYKKDVLEMMAWAERMATLGREEQKNFITYSLYMIRQSIMKNFTDGVLMRTSSGESAFLKNFARFITGNNVMEFNTLFSTAHYSVERNANAKLLFTTITFEVMRYIHRA